MKRWTVVTIVGAMLLAGVGLYAQSDLQQALKDSVGEHWIYDDLSKAVMQAKAANKPVLALFR